MTVTPIMFYNLRSISSYRMKGDDSVVEGKRRFKCAECAYEFEVSSKEKDLKCPKCKNRILFLVEGESLKGK